MNKLTSTALGTLLLVSYGVQADFVINDDLIVDGSECVGFDCVNGENFGFDTIRLKENNLRIKFEDTSVGTFPTNDWQLTANDSASGGSSKFSIEDITGTKVPFTVTAGAATNSIFVDSTGRVGFRTSTPVLDLHVNTSNTPAMRLEQNNSGGFTAQTWDVAGNEANFFVRDVTSGSRLPFRIRPGAPTSSIDIAADGDVGIGTGSPDTKLDVEAVDSAYITVQNTSTATATTREMMGFRNQGNALVAFYDLSKSPVDTFKWSMGTNGNDFRIITPVSAGAEFSLTNTGNLTITGTLTTGGVTCGGGCDLVFKPGYELESIEEHAALMWKQNHLPAVGATVEGEPFNITQKTGGILNELEKAHIYIEQLHNQLKDKEYELKDVQARLAQLEEKMK
jgi:hypothetical protein